MRPIQTEISLDREGFALLEQRSAVRDFWDEDEIRSVYYPEAAELIASVTGASRVFIFDHTLRRRIPGAIDRSRDAPRQPATRVHVPLPNPALSRCATWKARADRGRLRPGHPDLQAEIDMPNPNGELRPRIYRRVQSAGPTFHPEFLAAYVEALRLAGLPDE